MKLKLKRSEVKRLHIESTEWGRKVLEESVGEEFFKKRNFDDIKTFEDACEELGIDPETVIQENDTPDEAAYKKLKIVVTAINQGWVPDWDNKSQYKYWPWFNLSSGSGFSDSSSVYNSAFTTVGSRLCFESEEKSNYAAKQFNELYKQFLTINN